MVKHMKLRDLRELKKVMESKIKINRYARLEAALHYSAKELGWGKVVAEFKFHPVRKWRADFGIPSAKLLVEIEGGFWSGGRHGRGGGAIKDMEKYDVATIMGYAILRFTPQQANNLSAMRTIGDWFDAKRDSFDSDTENAHNQEEMKKEAEDVNN